MPNNKDFDLANTFSEREYLQFLAGKASATLGEELIIDGGVELDMDPVLQRSDLVKPLQTFSFPSSFLENWDDVLESVLIGYGSTVQERYTIDNFKVIYVASIYLYCHAKAAKSTGATNVAAALLACSAVNLGADEKLKLLRFVLWMFEKQPGSAYHLDYPKTSLLLCAYIADGGNSEVLLEKANGMFRLECEAVGIPPDTAVVRAALEGAKKLGGVESQLNADLILEQIGDASPYHQTCVDLFLRAFKDTGLDYSRVVMLRPVP